MPARKNSKTHSRNACLELAWEAWRAEGEKAFDVAIRCAIKACDALAEPYDRASVASWPLRAMLERDQTRHLERLLKSALKVAESIQPVSSQADALFLIWQAIHPSRRHRNKVLSKLVSACQCSKSWKGHYVLVDVALIVAAYDPQEAATIARQMRESPRKRTLLRKLERGETFEPRAFFWK